MGRNERIPDQEKEENRIAQEEEIEALEAIYGDAFEVVTRGSAASPHEVRIRVSEIPMVSLQLRLPEGYPSRDLPDVEIRSPGLGQAARKDLSEALRRPERGGTEATGCEGRSAAPSSPPGGGTVVIFDWAEMLKDLMSRADSAPHADPVADRPEASPGPECGDWIDGRGGVFEDGDGEGTGGWVRAISGSGGGGGSRGAFGEDEAEDAVPEEDFVEIFHGEPFTDRKSTFQAHLARVSSERQVSWARRRLLENGKIARATHNIAAWRVWDEGRGVQLHDNDDDGETAAGSRLAHMLAITGSQNVLVVVSRWFGGIHLGPDRFKHINNAARELLVQCGATAAAAASGGVGVGESKPGPAGGGKHRGRRKRGSGAGGK